MYHKEQNYKLFWFNDKLRSKVQTFKKSKQPEAGAGKSKEKLKRNSKLKTNQKPGGYKAGTQWTQEEWGTGAGTQEEQETFIFDEWAMGRKNPLTVYQLTFKYTGMMNK